MYKSFKKSKNKDTYAVFKCYRDMINSLIRKSKKQYYQRFFAENSFNIKKTWAGINSILNRKGKQKSTDIYLNINDSMLTDQKLVANKFNNYFVNVAGKLAKKIPKQNNKFQDFLKNPNKHSIFLEETTQLEIEDIIKSFGDNKASDIYGISTKLVKMGGSAIAKIMTTLFNKSLN